ncbi:hypothetical protein FB451DRAFT_1177104 [Mycena latifolia]|nr:hypothetical protein FB451DRAFT_1177104 [Mycena latifolia]
MSDGSTPYEHPRAPMSSNFGEIRKIRLAKSVQNFPRWLANINAGMNLPREAEGRDDKRAQTAAPTNRPSGHDGHRHHARPAPRTHGDQGLAALLFPLNTRSWPLVWHLRIFTSATPSARVATARLLWRGEAGGRARGVARGAHARGGAPVSRGVDVHIVDYSNYAKALDAARFRLALATSPTSSAAMAGCPLIYYPILANHVAHQPRTTTSSARSRCCRARASIGTWDDKCWPHAPNAQHRKSPPWVQKLPTNPLVATLKTPATPLFETAASSTPFTPGAGDGSAPEPEPDEVAKALLVHAIKEAAVKPDEAVLYRGDPAFAVVRLGRSRNMQYDARRRGDHSRSVRSCRCSA